MVGGSGLRGVVETPAVGRADLRLGGQHALASIYELAGHLGKAIL
jgi:hypothetical protein